MAVLTPAQLPLPRPRFEPLKLHPLDSVSAMNGYSTCSLSLPSEEQGRRLSTGTEALMTLGTGFNPSKVEEKRKAWHVTVVYEIKCRALNVCRSPKSDGNGMSKGSVLAVFGQRELCISNSLRVNFEAAARVSRIRIDVFPRSSFGHCGFVLDFHFCARLRRVQKCELELPFVLSRKNPLWAPIARILASWLWRPW